MQQDWIILRSTSGDIIARFDDWISFNVRRKTNDSAQATLTLNGNDSRTLLFGLDYIIELWRENKQSKIEAYREAELFHRTPEFRYDKKGQYAFYSHSVGFEDLLKRRIVYNYAGTIWADKNAVAESVMKEYVDEQAGPNATVASGRLVAGVTPNLAIEFDSSTGANWQGAKAWNNLLDLLQDIGDTHSMAFKVESVDLRVPNFVFRAYPKPYGTNKTNTSVSPATGRNVFGNFPVIFSDQFDNLSKPSLSISRDNEANVAVIIGRGTEQDRSYQERTLPLTSYNTDSPWNRREITVHATQEVTVQARTYRGDVVLQKTVPQTMIDGEIIQHPSCLYGRDYLLGDMVTFRIGNIEVQKTITAVTIDVQGRKGDFAESIDIEVSD